MNPVTIALIIILLVAIWWLLRKRGETAVEPEQDQIRPQLNPTQFHAVSIKYSGKACTAAHQMAGRRFLATAAPKLPLPECDVLDCSCRFAHHDDRRSNKDRRSPFSTGGFGGTTGSYAHEKRDGTDRRKSAD